MPICRELLQPEDLSDPQSRLLYDTLLRLEPGQFAAADLAQLGEQFPQLDAPLRALLIEEPRSVRLNDSEGKAAIVSPERELRAQIAYVKEQEKERLLQHLKRALGSEEEELAMRRYLRLRNDLRTMQVDARAPAPASNPNVA